MKCPMCGYADSKVIDSMNSVHNITFKRRIKTCCIHTALTSECKLKFKTGESCFNRFFTEIIKSLLCVFHSAETFYKICKVVNHVHGFAVYFIIGRM